MTVDGIPIGLSDIGVVALVLLFGIGLATGRIYTRAQVLERDAAHAREVKRMEEARAQALADSTHERNEWRTEARLNQQSIMELSEQNRAMLTAFGPTLTDFLRGLRRAGVGADVEGDT